MYQGYFINLDRNETRRIALLEHLNRIGAAERYQRIAAVDGRAVADQYPTKLEPGELGLWLSHAKLLETAASANGHLHIVEDDAIFAADALPIFDSLLDVADARFDGWDLIFTDALISPLDIGFFLTASQVIEQADKKGRALIDLKARTLSCTSSFFLNQRSIGKYASLIADQWKQGLPIDMYLRKLVEKGTLRAYLTIPFVTSVSRASLHSDIRGGEVNQSLAALDVYRRGFFEDADLESLDAELEELIQEVNHTPLRIHYLKTLFFCLSDRFVI